MRFSIIVVKLFIRYTEAVALTIKRAESFQSAAAEGRPDHPNNPDSLQEAMGF